MAISTATRMTPEAAPAPGFGVGYQLLAFAEVLLLGVWLGAMGFFSFAVPQSGFAVLPNRQLVGLLVTSTITKVEVLSLVLGGLLIILQLASWKVRGSSKSLRLALVILMVIAMAASRFWITPEMVSLRNAMGPVMENVPASDPIRMAFNKMHVYSVSAIMTAMLAGVTTLFLTVRSWLKR